MSRTPQKPTKVIGVAGEQTEKLIAAARALAMKMVNVEQDPDLLSVFSIARAHGYKATSTFWHVELKALVELFNQRDAAQRQEKVVEFPAAAAAPGQDQAPIAE